ncbi:TetR/AcrR family transcriptional regulator [Microbacterium sp. 69-7]|uniref:TetR/AcrR family transcriptional regulator n=1 Tax=Microbacterium sp. 69-7 TaxID=1895784 RepID=UPI00338DD496
MATGRRPPARNEELLDASVRAFAPRGYFGTSTAEVAKAMGVSQPYVIRTFGSKRELFLRTHAHAAGAILTAFRSASRGRVAGDGFDAERVGAAYRDLARARPGGGSCLLCGDGGAHHRRGVPPDVPGGLSRAARAGGLRHGDVGVHGARHAHQHPPAHAGPPVSRPTTISPPSSIWSSARHPLPSPPMPQRIRHD